MRNDMLPILNIEKNIKKLVVSIIKNIKTTKSLRINNEQLQGKDITIIMKAGRRKKHLLKDISVPRRDKKQNIEVEENGKLIKNSKRIMRRLQQ